MEHNPTQTLNIEIDMDASKGIKTLRLKGPATIHNLFEFQDVARKQPWPRVLLVDVSAVPYIDSAALGSFVGIHVSCEATKRKYALVGANERLKTLFELTHVRDFLVMYDTMDEALAQVG